MSRGKYLITVLLAVVPAVLAILVIVSPDIIDRRAIAFAFMFTSYSFMGIDYFILRPLYRYSRKDVLLRQVEALSKSLKQAGVISATLEMEIQNRTTVLERLKVQSAVAKRILSELTQEEYDAVVAVIHAQSRTKQVKQIALSFLLGMATNILTYFLLESRRW